MEGPETATLHPGLVTRVPHRGGELSGRHGGHSLRGAAAPTGVCSGGGGGKDPARPRDWRAGLCGVKLLYLGDPPPPPAGPLPPGDGGQGEGTALPLAAAHTGMLGSSLPARLGHSPHTGLWIEATCCPGCQGASTLCLAWHCPPPPSGLGRGCGPRGSALRRKPCVLEAWVSAWPL